MFFFNPSGNETGQNLQQTALITKMTFDEKLFSNSEGNSDFDAILTSLEFNKDTNIYYGRILILFSRRVGLF